MPPPLSKPLWLDRFASHVGALLPSVAAGEAWCYAEAAFDDANDLTPDEAAEIFALELPPLDVGAPE